MQAQSKKMLFLLLYKVVLCASRLCMLWLQCVFAWSCGCGFPPEQPCWSPHAAPLGAHRLLLKMALLSSGVSLLHLRLLRIIYFPPTDGALGVSSPSGRCFNAPAAHGWISPPQKITLTFPFYCPAMGSNPPMWCQPFHSFTEPAFLKIQAVLLSHAPLLWMNDSSVTINLWKVS